MDLKSLSVGSPKVLRPPTFLISICFGLSLPVSSSAADFDVYVNSAPQGLSGIAYNGFFFRSPAGGEYPKQCPVKLGGFCFLATGNRVTRVSSEVILITNRNDKLPTYLCRASFNKPKNWGECSRNGWIDSKR